MAAAPRDFGLGAPPHRDSKVPPGSMVYKDHYGLRRKAAGALGSSAEEEERYCRKAHVGGVAFMHKGKMALGVQDQDLMVKVGAEHYDDALERPHVRPMDFTGKPLKGYVYVAPAGFRTSAALKAWIERGLVGASSGPPKKKAPKKGASKKATPKRKSERKAAATTKKAAPKRKSKKKATAATTKKAKSAATARKTPADKRGRQASPRGRR